MDRKSHASQYLNNPTLASEQDFTREGILKLFVDWTTMPTREMHTWATVDLAYSDKKGRDFTVIVIGGWHNDTLWIKDIIRGRFNADELPNEIVSAIQDYPEVEGMGIEESVGAKWLKNDIFRAAEQRGITLPPVEWISLGQGELNAKDNRIKGLIPLYKEGRLKILNNVRTDQEEIIGEFTRSRGKRDVPDATSRLLKYRTQAESPEDKQEKIDRRRQQREQDMHDLIFGQGKYAYVESPAPVVEEPPEPEVDIDLVTGLPNGDAYQGRYY